MIKTFLIYSLVDRCIDILFSKIERLFVPSPPLRKHSSDGSFSDDRCIVTIVTEDPEYPQVYDVLWDAKVIRKYREDDEDEDNVVVGYSKIERHYNGDVDYEFIDECGEVEYWYSVWDNRDIRLMVGQDLNI